MKILLATDGSPSSEAAVQSVATRPWPAGSEAKLISVVEIHIAPAPGSWFVPDSHYLKLLHDLQEHAREAIEKAETQFKGAQTSLALTSEVIVGNTRDTILKQAEGWGADLIVLGSHGHKGINRFLLGSVSQSVAAQAHCSVEIVRSH
ncbi:MAG: universal stress protein [Deltaproteobacteria bacterium]|nr:universal stress protein [Deltaproteobacteria bacterium]